MDNNISIKEISTNMAAILNEDNEYIEGIVRLFFSEMVNEVKKGNRVKIPHFGFFFLKKHKARKSGLKNLQEKLVEEFAKLNFEPSEIMREYSV